MKIETVRLPRGSKVLARNGKYGIEPIHYANYKQANSKVEELRKEGFEVFVTGHGRPAKYIQFVEN